MTRSKSVGSVADLVITGNQSNLTHQPSSLSLNNMEQLESTQLESVLQGVFLITVFLQLQKFYNISVNFLNTR